MSICIGCSIVVYCPKKTISVLLKSETLLEPFSHWFESSLFVFDLGNSFGHPRLRSIQNPTAVIDPDNSDDSDDSDSSESSVASSASSSTVRSPRAQWFIQGRVGQVQCMACGQTLASLGLQVFGYAALHFFNSLELEGTDWLEQEHTSKAKICGALEPLQNEVGWEP